MNLGAAITTLVLLAAVLFGGCLMVNSLREERKIQQARRRHPAGKSLPNEDNPDFLAWVAKKARQGRP